MSNINLQELADLPGAGKAEKQLRAAKCWNEAAGEGPLWWVTVDGSVPTTCTFQVRAKDREEARRKAMNIAAEGDDVVWDYSPFLVTVHHATAFEADE
ncbi:MAG: hypothetical protein Q4G49_03200 [Paracoccus sp. (in: a-proteobacteria)]|nr:hypothetical protein [Paracoccus sp. (in: a-proteobacteria)]